MKGAVYCLWSALVDWFGITFIAHTSDEEMYVLTFCLGVLAACPLPFYLDSKFIAAMPEVARSF